MDRKKAVLQGSLFELNAISALQEKFPDAIFFNNVTVYSHVLQKDTQVDVIMLHSKGIFVIELKDWRDYIEGEYNDVYWAGKGRAKSTLDVFNPLDQNFIHCRALWLKAFDAGVHLAPFYNFVCVPNGTQVYSQCKEVMNLDSLINAISRCIIKSSFNFDLFSLYSKVCSCWGLV